MAVHSMFVVGGQCTRYLKIGQHPDARDAPDARTILHHTTERRRSLALGARSAHASHTSLCIRSHSHISELITDELIELMRRIVTQNAIHMHPVALL